MLQLFTWALLGGLAGAVVGWQLKQPRTRLPDNIVDGMLGGCVAGELLRRFDASHSTSVVGLIAALGGGIVFVLLMTRLRHV